jgi:hypothetical protein
MWMKASAQEARSDEGVDDIREGCQLALKVMDMLFGELCLLA